ncbi:ABC transporter ATP-binding protein [Clostridium botulinum]|uniref:ABC transporter, ATP-binding protein n=3 Tax=Clostridium botulinum TaxID=1491 RepID=A5I1Y8_CLOBH|nr:ABC transporter ATP-binding protein [Clostridium botulinum]EKN43157.1 peptide ABC transporter, Pep4E family, ATP-binding protein [Clostridium botulinum CFSAN001627]EPS46961.1 peptide ABC transporter, Pep4E family, ATP-binding protein [Clostridium botulinum CFSAN002367]EPS47576.1 peptide ABC transporter, Pep4E family, ATP-binding protein [Clostridium botulinum CFSAN002369]ABS35185.1 peptide ABC transporter, Pep4E family, ATP-binding protein [Clostridium botulinum A str. ATCC 19397]ABS37324.1
MYLSLKNIGKKFNITGREFWVLKDINLEIEKGNIVTILGPSGSGKSTLLNIIGGIDKADSGEFVLKENIISNLKDQELTLYRREKLGFVFQFYNLIPNLTVWENVEVTSNISNNPRDIKEILKKVQLYDKRDKFPQELSGGEQQRVSIARAIIKNPELLLCDEPTGALDYTTSKEILKLLEEINKEFNTTILIVTHNEAIASISDKIVKIRDGGISEFIDNKEKISAEMVVW